jgi:protein-disulfide isomerase
MISPARTIILLAVVAALAACGGAHDASTPQDVPAVAHATPATQTAAPAPRPAFASPPQEGDAPDHKPRRVVLHGIDLTGIGYDEGDPRAPVVIVNFSDFGCPYCGVYARETHPAIAREFIATGKVFYKYVPFVMGMFPNGDKAARAAECAADQGKFAAMHDRLYADQAAWKRGGSPAQVFAQAAVVIGLDRARFDACLADGHTDVRTAAAIDVARQLAIRATPSFFIDDELVEGALPLDVFRKVLEQVTSGSSR